MRIKLIKLAQELNSSISDIAKFLNENGREVIEDANETLDDETADFVRDNLVVKGSDIEDSIVEEKNNQHHHDRRIGCGHCVDDLRSNRRRNL
jgi:ectoine hydroxylase-related dioxygenase (phytanoyl-CoA dioxygenase family)